MVDLQIRLLKQFSYVQVSYIGSGRCAHEAYTKASNMTTPLMVDECGVEI